MHGWVGGWMDLTGDMKCWMSDCLEQSALTLRSLSYALLVYCSPLSHYCDVSGDVMSLYGVESLCELDKNWGVQATAAVTTIAFHFVYFDSVMESLYKIKGKFPGVVVRSLEQ